MKNLASTKAAAAACIAALSVAASAATAQESWPSGPVKIVVPYAAGGATDNVARVFAAQYQKRWGQSVIVENRPGAAGNIGASYVAKSPADGLTLLVGVSSMAAVSALYKKLAHDPLLEMKPVAGLVTSPSLMVVNASVPANTVQELIALAKSQPGKLNYGSTGMGSGGQLAFEYFNSLAGTSLAHIPYQGDAPLMPALLSNQVQTAVLQPTVAVPQIQAGKIKALAVTTRARFSQMPDVPTVSESGIAGYDYTSWVGIFAPAGTPDAIVAKINADTLKILRDDAIGAYLSNWKVDPFPVSPEDFKKQFSNDVAKYKQIVRDAKIPQVD